MRQAEAAAVRKRDPSIFKLVEEKPVVGHRHDASAASAHGRVVGEVVVYGRLPSGESWIICAAPFTATPLTSGALPSRPPIHTSPVYSGARDRPALKVDRRNVDGLVGHPLAAVSLERCHTEAAAQAVFFTVP